MKKIISAIILSVTFIGLVGCAKNTESSLQANKWNVVSSDGSSFTAEFGEDTVKFENVFRTRGLKYQVKDDKITMKDDRVEVSYTIKKNGNEYKFKSNDDTTKEEFGDLTLSKAK